MEICFSLWLSDSLMHILKPFYCFMSLVHVMSQCSIRLSGEHSPLTGVRQLLWQSVEGFRLELHVVEDVLEALGLLGQAVFECLSTYPHQNTFWFCSIFPLEPLTKQSLLSPPLAFLTSAYLFFISLRLSFSGPFIIIHHSRRGGSWSQHLPAVGL